MLAKVEYGGVQKYIKVPQTDDNFHFLQFLQEGLCNSNKGIIIAQIAILIIDEVAYVFIYFLFLPATDKFSLQAQHLSEGVLALTDASDTEVDADTFDELIKSGVRNFKVGYRKYPVTGKDKPFESKHPYIMEAGCSCSCFSTNRCVCIFDFISRVGH